MTTELLQSLLGWCLCINLAILLVWTLFFLLGHDLMYRMHGKMFRLSVETFDALHYGGLAAFKIVLIVFNIAPYVALRIVA